VIFLLFILFLGVYFPQPLPFLVFETFAFPFFFEDILFVIIRDILISSSDLSSEICSLEDSFSLSSFNIF